MNYKHNANGLPFTMSSHKTIPQQSNNFKRLKTPFPHNYT